MKNKWLQVRMTEKEKTELDEFTNMITLVDDMSDCVRKMFKFAQWNLPTFLYFLNEVEPEYDTKQEAG